MEFTRSVITSLHQGEFLISVDNKDVYLFAPIFLAQSFLHFAVGPCTASLQALGLLSACMFPQGTNPTISSCGIFIMEYFDDHLFREQLVSFVAQCGFARADIKLVWVDPEPSEMALVPNTGTRVPGPDFGLLQSSPVCPV